MAQPIESRLVFCGIAPHPPIMVPEVGREAIAEVRGSIEAMAELTSRVIDSGAKTVILISPHAPLDAQAFVAYHTPELYGDFANFRAPDASVGFPLDEELLEEITTAATENGYEVLKLHQYDLDHGSAVPLYFLDRNGWRGSVVALGYSFLSNEDHVKFGNVIKQAIGQAGDRVALIASGDLSHRLKPEAPAGFNPSAHLFDEQVVDAIQSHTPDEIVQIDPDLRRMAGECGYRSMLIALGAVKGLPEACEVLHYEAPFGVGYLVAQLTNVKTQPRAIADEVKSDQSFGSELPALAKEAVEHYVRTGKELPLTTHPTELLQSRAACFVSLKTRNGDLRGCIGTIEPAKTSLAEEVIANAMNAATRDPRFPPVSAHELPHLVYSVDVLHPPEPTTFEGLDPAVFGVIVEDESGIGRGLLLPAIEGVDTVEKQVEIAARKAGIAPGANLKLSRFRVERYLGG